MPSLHEAWAAIQKDLAAEEELLVSEVRHAWASLETALDILAERFRTEPRLNPENGRADLDAFIRSAGEAFLFDLGRTLAAARPLERVLEAFERYHSDVWNTVHRAPESIVASSEDLRSAMEPAGMGWFRARLSQWRKPREIPLRSLLVRHAGERTIKRLQIDGRCSLLLARAQLHALGPWQHVRRSAFRGLSGLPAESDRFDENRTRWFNATHRLRQESHETLRLYDRSRDESAAALARSADSRRSENAGADDRRQRALGYWSRQQRAVSAVLKVETDVARLALEASAAANGPILSLNEERQSLIEELNAVIAGWRTGPLTAPHGFSRRRRPMSRRPRNAPPSGSAR